MVEIETQRVKEAEEKGKRTSTLHRKKKIELLMEIEEKDKVIEGLEKEKEEYLDVAKRLKADFENYKKREIAEKNQLKEAYQNEIILDVLPIFDNLERALKEENKEKLRDGLLLIKREFENLLLKRNVVRIETIGCEFSPKLHNVILSIPSKEKEGIILEEVESGWVSGGVCLKPAVVIVSKGCEEGLEKGA